MQQQVFGSRKRTNQCEAGIRKWTAGWAPSLCSGYLEEFIWTILGDLKVWDDKWEIIVYVLMGLPVRPTKNTGCWVVIGRVQPRRPVFCANGDKKGLADRTGSRILPPRTTGVWPVQNTQT